MRLRSFLLGFIIFIYSNLTYSMQYSLDDYFDQVDKMPSSVIKINQNHKQELKNYYIQHNLSPQNFLNKQELKIKREDFTILRSNLRNEWTTNIGREWPTYQKNTICLKNGQCYWKRPGYSFDAHHIFPLSHKGPNCWQNIWPLTTNDHTALHSKAGPCCSIFPKSCGSRGKEVEFTKYYTGWTQSKNRKTISRIINKKNVAITKVNGKSSYYKITVNAKPGGKTYNKLRDAKKATIVEAFGLQ